MHLVKATFRFFAVYLLWVMLGIAAADEELQVDEYRLDIAPLPLSASIRELRRQTGLNLISFAPFPRDVMVGPLQGNFTAEAALRQLLANSDFRYERVNERTFSLSKGTAIYGKSGLQPK